MREVRRIALITQGLTRVVRPMANSGHELLAIFEAPPRSPKRKRVSSSLFQILGTFYRRLRRKKTLRQFCDENAIPYIDMTGLSDKDLTDWIRDNDIELLVVFSMSRLLPRCVFSAPKYGTINLHPSFLPEYRGPNPWFWTYFHMEKQGGVSVHLIDEGEDTGDILLQERYPIAKGTRSPEIQDLAVGKIGVELLLKAIDEIETLPRVSQPSVSPTARARNLRPEEHAKIIDWQNWPIDRIWHLLRGTELWLNAIDQPSGFYRGMRWTVCEWEKADVAGLPSHLGRFRGRKALFCRDGVIYLKVNFNISIFIRNILSR